MGEDIEVSQREVLVTRESVVARPCRFLDVTDGALLDYFIGLLSSEDRNLIEKLYSVGQGICSVQYSQLKVALETDFTYFSAAANGTLVPEHLHEQEEELNVQEKRFLQNLLKIMEASHYNLLTSSEWFAAAAEDFLLTLPVTVKWDAMEDTMLQESLWSEFPEIRQEMPEEIADRILIFHRGVDTARLEGYYYAQKIDLLINFYLIQPTLKALLWVLRMLGLKSTIAEEAASNYLSEKIEENTEDGNEVKDQKHKASIRIERKTFAREFPDGPSVLRNLTKKITLQEACWKDVVVIYRKQESQKKGEFDIVSDIDAEVVKKNIVIKRFESIPIADMELVFPEKKIHMPPRVLINIMVTLIGALIATLNSFIVGMSPAILWTTLTMLATRLGQVYSTAATEKSAIERSMQRLLYDRTVGSQKSALSSLIDDMYRQRTRQILIAYCMLLHHFQNKNYLDVKQLDDLCEDMLKEKFSLDVDFTCEEAVRILSGWGIVSVSPDGCTLVPLPLAECLEALEKAWLKSMENPKSIRDRLLSNISISSTLSGVFNPLKSKTKKFSKHISNMGKVSSLVPGSSTSSTKTPKKRTGFISKLFTKSHEA